MPSLAPHHLERVQESGQLVEPLRTIGGHSIFDESIEFVDVGKTQLIKVLLALQTFNWNWSKYRKTLVRSQKHNYFGKSLKKHECVLPLCVFAVQGDNSLMLKRSKAFMHRNSSWVIWSRRNSWEMCLIRMQCSYMVEMCIRCLQVKKKVSESEVIGISKSGRKMTNCCASWPSETKRTKCQRSEPRSSGAGRH